MKPLRNPSVLFDAPMPEEFWIDLIAKAGMPDSIDTHMALELLVKVLRESSLTSAHQAALVMAGAALYAHCSVERCVLKN